MFFSPLFSLHIYFRRQEKISSLASTSNTKNNIVHSRLQYSLSHSCKAMCIDITRCMCVCVCLRVCVRALTKTVVVNGCCANAKYGNRLLRKIDKLNLGLFLSVRRERMHHVHYTFKILSLHTCVTRIVQPRVAEKKQRRDYTCLLRDAVVSALVMRPFVTDPFWRRDYICVYAYENICTFYSEPLYQSLYVVSCDSKDVGKFYRSLNMNTSADRKKKKL